MKTRQRRRRTPKKQCLCDCDATIKSPQIQNSNNNKKKFGSPLKVNKKSIIIQKTTKKRNSKARVSTGSIKKQINNGTSLVITLKKSPIEETNKNNGKILIKEPYVLLKRLNIKPPTMELRRNRQKNYCEPPSFHDESTKEKSIEKPTEKIPIYKQQIGDDTNKPKKNEKKKNKKKDKIDDLYEFESDSEDTKHKRSKKPKLNDSSYDEYNKTIENILKNVALKIKERKHGPDKKTTDTNTKNYSNNNNERDKRIRVNRRKLNEEEMLDNKIEKIDKKTTTTNSNTNNNEKDKRARIKRSDKNQEQTFKKQIIEDKIDNEKSSNSPKPSSDNIQHVEKSSDFNKKDSLVSSSKLPSNDNDETFGFLDDNEEMTEISTDEQSNRTPKIHIISNIKLKPHQQLIFTKNPIQSPIVQPNANSTMIYNVLTPWRFNEINIRRNPHLIQVKKSALPCITQEPVLEYSIIEKLANSSTPHHNGGGDQSFNDSKNKENSIVQTPMLRRSPRKYGTPTTQKTLDDYYGSNSENKENRRVITRYSLFDVDELSPIKTNEDKRSPLEKIMSIKRQILGDFNENIQISTNNLNKIQDNHNKNEIKTYFGFDTSKESDDNISNIDNDKANKDDRPYRLSINTNDKKYEAKKKQKRVEDYDDDEEAIEDPPNKLISDDDDDDDGGRSDAESVGGGLFEEMHDDKEMTENKTIKKRKVKWMLTDDDDDDAKPRKRRKDVRTKKEEQEAERWAEQFNSMCKEVDEFTLEIE